MHEDQLSCMHARTRNQNIIFPVSSPPARALLFRHSVSCLYQEVRHEDFQGPLLFILDFFFIGSKCEGCFISIVQRTYTGLCKSSAKRERWSQHTCERRGRGRLVHFPPPLLDEGYQNRLLPEKDYVHARVDLKANWEPEILEMHKAAGNDTTGRARPPRWSI